jgi:hypothetical protein
MLYVKSQVFDVGEQLDKGLISRDVKFSRNRSKSPRCVTEGADTDSNGAKPSISIAMRVTDDNRESRAGYKTKSVSFPGALWMTSSSEGKRKDGP